MNLSFQFAKLRGVLPRAKGNPCRSALVRWALLGLAAVLFLPRLCAADSMPGCVVMVDAIRLQSSPTKPLLEFKLRLALRDAPSASISPESLFAPLQRASWRGKEGTLFRPATPFRMDDPGFWSVSGSFDLVAGVTNAVTVTYDCKPAGMEPINNHLIHSRVEIPRQLEYLVFDLVEGKVGNESQEREILLSGFGQAKVE